MLEYITQKSIFHSKSTLFYVLLFFGVRLLSFLVAPYPIITSVIMILLLVLFGMMYYHSPSHAFLILLIEFFLGGSGHMFELFTLSLRSILLLTFAVLTVLHQIGVHFYHEQKHIPNAIIATIFLLIGYIFFAAGKGYAVGHGVGAIQDAIPYLFLPLIFPAFAMYRRNSFLRTHTVRLAMVTILCSAFFRLVTFVLFATGITRIHGTFYKWFRDVNMGKITDLGDHFFRIVEPSALLAVPLLLIITSLIMRKEKHHTLWWVLHGSLILTLVLNLSRGYILGLLVGLVFLLFKRSFTRWAKISAYTVGLFLVMFIGIHFTASGFTNPGFDELGLRSVSIANPTSELSSATRMELLPVILAQINEQPVFGRGLGASVQYYDSALVTYRSTPQYDWGYFEMLAELGIVGTLLYLFLIFYALYRTLQIIAHVHDYQEFHIGVIASLASLLVMHITAPVLTHVYGILFVVFALLIATKPLSMFDQFIIFLYRIFNKKHAA